MVAVCVRVHIWMYMTLQLHSELHAVLKFEVTPVHTLAQHYAVQKCLYIEVLY